MSLHRYECSVRIRAGGEAREGREGRKRRYYSRRAADEPAAPAVAARLAALRDLLARAPGDVMLWEKYIDFQVTLGGTWVTLHVF